MSRQNPTTDARTKKNGVPNNGKKKVSLNTLLHRIRRALPKDQRLKRSRPASYVGGKRGGTPIYPDDVGRYYILNVKHETVAETHIDLEAFARRHQVLRAWEVLVTRD